MVYFVKKEENRNYIWEREREREREIGHYQKVDMNSWDQDF